MNKRGQKEIIPLENEKIAQLKQKALKVSIAEGSATNFSAGIAENYVTPFALALKASPLQIGFLNSLSGLLAPLAQFYGDKLMEHHPRKKIVMKFVFLQALMWLPIAALSFFFWKGIASNHLPLILILVYSILSALGGIAYPAWFSWMGDLVPENERGKYFSRRNRITGAVGLVAVLVGGFLLDIFKTRGFVLLGFSILFVLASAGRFFSYSLFKNQYSPQFKLKKGDYFSFWSFIKRFDNYGKFAVFNGLFNFVLMIASPFFAVYMLEDLSFNYITYTIVSMSSTVFYLLFTPLVGKFSDRYGNKKLFSFSCFLFSINPILWMLIKNPVALTLVPQVLVGLANAAMVLAVNNFTYDAVTPKHRPICITYTNILAGIGVFAGSLLGGYLIKLHPTAMNPILFVFLISAIGRLAVSVLLIPRIKEQKKVKKLQIVHFSITHPIKTFYNEVLWLRRFFR